MSNIIGSCLTHYNDQHIQVRKDFYDLCAYNKADFNQGLTKSGKKVKDEPNQECMAMILRLLETLTNRNNGTWITLSYSAIAALIYHTYSEGTIRKSIAALLAKGYIQCRQETKGSIPSYALNISVIQTALDQQRNDCVQKRVEALKQGANISKEAVNIDRGDVNIDSPGLSILTPNKITNKIMTNGGDKTTTITEKPTVSEPKECAPSFSSPKVSTQSQPREKQRDVLHKEPTPIEQVYQDYDHALKETQIVDADYRTPRNPSNDREMKNLYEQGVTYQKLLRVIKSLCSDPDDYYRKNINTGFVAKHYAARLKQPSDNNPPRKSLSGLRDLRSLVSGGK